MLGLANEEEKFISMRILLAIPAYIGIHPQMVRAGYLNIGMRHKLKTEFEKVYKKIGVYPSHSICKFDRL